MANRYSFLFSCFLWISAVILLPGVLCSCGARSSPVTRTVFGMDTVCSVTVYRQKDAEAAEKALKLLSEYELVFSRTSEDSELFKLNENAGNETAVSDDLYRILETCLRFSELSGGRFDITLGGVSALYDFTGETGTIPSEDELRAALSHTGYEKVKLLPGDRVLVEDPGLVIDLGAAAKGYTADRMREVLLAEGVPSAIINLGGNVLTIGKNPSGEAFSVGIAKPFKDSSEALFIVPSEDASVATSGVYQRSFEKDGVLWHHLLDPETGLPIRNGLLSVSVVSDDSLTADILSTAAFALGPEASKSLISGLDGVKVYFVDEGLNVTEIP